MNDFAYMDEQMTNFIAQHAVAFCITYAIIFLIAIVSYWKLFKKAGKPGWAILVPFYNIYVLMKVAKMSLWWLLLLVAAFIPFIGGAAGLVFGLMQSIKLSQAFRKSIWFALGIFFFGIIFIPILAFGNSTHVDNPTAE